MFEIGVEDGTSVNDNDGISAHDHGAVRENTNNLDRGTLYGALSFVSIETLPQSHLVPLRMQIIDACFAQCASVQKILIVIPNT